MSYTPQAVMTTKAPMVRKRKTCKGGIRLKNSLTPQLLYQIIKKYYQYQNLNRDLKMRPPIVKSRKGSCTYYVITDGGGSLQMITALHRGMSSQMITVLYRGGPANDYSIT